MSDDRVYQTVESGVVAIDSTGDKYTYTVVTPMLLIRTGVVGTTTYDGSTDAVIAADINSSDGDGTFTRGDGDAGVIDLSDDADFANGMMAYNDLTSRTVVKPGDQIIFQVTTAASAGDGVVFIEYQKLPMQTGYDSLLANSTEV